MLFIRFSLFLVNILLFTNCYNYLSEDVPIIVRPELKQRISLLTIKVTSPESERSKKHITALYTTYINDTGYFGRVINEGIRSSHHIDIYTSEVNEYEHFWVSSISSLFMILTAGILPSIYSQERVLHADFYVEEKLVGREKYRQKHSTLFGVPFFFIWESGIEEAKIIQYNKERNMINNMIQDYNRYL
ncbi:hypothetical protein [Leptospira ilyithenensis]|uniref:Uncharacterized protein n=1 Tax=Leptospira ilyithenensis TaxID=2484901 RepID=A0A4R9LL33_9LEPT|nr:hypothetical protein [Leptospira ilyithenensis]TGN06479.1 hypothetical protein EHS11_19190 [Leptospira ilyithenensis]